MFELQRANLHLVEVADERQEPHMLSRLNTGADDSRDTALRPGEQLVRQDGRSGCPNARDVGGDPITQVTAPVSGSNRLMIARWLGRPRARLPSNTLTIFTQICIPGCHADMVSEKPRPGTVTSGRGGHCTSPRASAPNEASSSQSSSAGSRCCTTAASLRVSTSRMPFPTSKAAFVMLAKISDQRSACAAAAVSHDPRWWSRIRLRSIVTCAVELD